MFGEIPQYFRFVATTLAQLKIMTMDINSAGPTAEDMIHQHSADDRCSKVDILTYVQTEMARIHGLLLLVWFNHTQSIPI